MDSVFGNSQLAFGFLCGRDQKRERQAVPLTLKRTSAKKNIRRPNFACKNIHVNVIYSVSQQKITQSRLSTTTTAAATTTTTTTAGAAATTTNTFITTTIIFCFPAVVFGIHFIQLWHTSEPVQLKAMHSTSVTLTNNSPAASRL